MMPPSMEAFLVKRITKERGYDADWKPLDLSKPDTLETQQTLHVMLMRAFVQKNDYLTKEGFIAPELFYPSRQEALHAASTYRKVVATQRFTLGKDVFDETPLTYRYYRDAKHAFTHLDGTPYRQGEVITDRAVEKEATLLEGVGITPTLIDEKSVLFEGEYSPLLSDPLVFQHYAK